ncbi:MAG: ribonuclease HII [Methanomicrobiaceae archaeon]|nr:ribonuclease HII [Methanomicrobiaceae archaeon]
MDEAGKGAVLGPLVVAGVACPSSSVLEGLGIRDSKLLSPKKREELYPEILSRCHVHTLQIAPDQIDLLRSTRTMNEICAASHAEVISVLSPEIAYVDACDVNAIRYGWAVEALLSRSCPVVAEHHAETAHLPVAAASIVAKVERDHAVRVLEEDYGVVGSGYPSDPFTLSFLDTYIAAHRHPPPCSRRSWKTVSFMVNKLHQSTLSEFFP